MFFLAFQGLPVADVTVISQAVPIFASILAIIFLKEIIGYYIVEQAMHYALGARGLRSLCEAILTDAMFELPGTKATSLKVTKRYAENKLSGVELNQLKAAS